ncbi:uncharacterized protein LOC120353391 [Nilaparvata lugens]|uniref:uncharacterized protein LOC120353391 n=1 Tax=Nilaparvata lugens TaxID=108931 RepID=UPI00193D7F6D|nr:uncharacterized protein LOC120353391 [Nilaparvata lugens]XP_039292887.1 uncharacterized protein LOC120353391 [Nilaparvata lugens]XP_039292889.1 uncharacterized protein LOC120353391 [Nilaparvata lugens]
MAPYQCPKQVLIWSLPTLAVLISLFWYRRRRPSLKSDPGGTAAEQASIGDHPSISRTAGQLLNAIEKARRDLETSQPIAEVEEVRSVELSAKEISVKQTSKVVENQQIPEKISVKKIACEKPVKINK